MAVVAGAGTGKTHMLTERYLHHLSEDGLSPLEVVAVTFTEKAAGELRSRVRERVRERAGSPGRRLGGARGRPDQHHPRPVCPDMPRAPGRGGGRRRTSDVLDELRGRLWTADRLADAMDELPLEHYQVVALSPDAGGPGGLLRGSPRGGAGPGEGPRGMGALVTEARETALETFLEDPVLKEAKGPWSSARGTTGTAWRSPGARPSLRWSELEADEGQTLTANLLSRPWTSIEADAAGRRASGARESCPGSRRRSRRYGSWPVRSYGVGSSPSSSGRRTSG